MILVHVTQSTKVMLQVLSVSSSCIDVSIQHVMAATSVFDNYTFCPSIIILSVLAWFPVTLIGIRPQCGEGSATDSNKKQLPPRRHHTHVHCATERQ